MIQRAALTRHMSGFAVPIVMMFACSAIAPIAAAAAVASYLAAFMLTHELAHGALGLSRRRNEVALAIAGVCIVTSGHALRLMHLRHHADPLGPGDLEGRPARMSPGRALVAAPWLAVTLVIAAWRGATARDRAWQCAEYAAIAGVVLLAARGPRAALG
jgi:fatty acid desaturase